jgi:hypothetical protein
MRAEDYLRWLRQTRHDEGRWDAVAAGSPPAILFWYRSSPRGLLPQMRSLSTVQSLVTVNDPPIDETDMRLVVLDGRGRLQEFRSVPPQRDTSTDKPSEPAWARAFDAAGLDMRAFASVPPEWTPRDYADTRAAWEGPLPRQQSMRIRVEGSAYRGKLVSFAVIGPWTRPALMQPRQRAAIDRLVGTAATVLVCIVLGVAVLLARRNLRSARADRRGAARLAAAMGAIGFLSWLFGAHHLWAVEAEFDSLFRAAGQFALVSAIMWAMYLALEPYVRRLWPDSLLGWSRLLAGHIRDPRVGRDVLIGAVFGVLVILIGVARDGLIPWLGYPAPSPTFGADVHVLTGPGALTSTWMLSLFGAVQGALLMVLVVVLLRLTLRRTWLSAPVTVLVMSLRFLENAGTTTTSLVLLFVVASGAVLTWVVFRSGLLAFAVALLVEIMATNVPMRQNMFHWSAAAGNWTLAALVALACFGFYASRAGQPLFGTILKE